MMKVEAWKNGISPNEFKKCKLKDLRDISDINQAIGDKKQREHIIQTMMSNMRM